MGTHTHNTHTAGQPAPSDCETKRGSPCGARAARAFSSQSAPNTLRATAAAFFPTSTASQSAVPGRGAETICTRGFVVIDEHCEALTTELIENLMRTLTDEQRAKLDAIREERL